MNFEKKGTQVQIRCLKYAVEFEQNLKPLFLYQREELRRSRLKKKKDLTEKKGVKYLRLVSQLFKG